MDTPEPLPNTGGMRVYAVNPSPFMPPGYRNPMSNATKIALALLGVAAVGGTIYYFKRRRAPVAPPLGPGPGPSPTPLPAGPRDLGTFVASEVIKLPDPVVFVLNSGDSFSLDLGVDYELVQLVYGEEAKLELSEQAIDRMQVTAPRNWGAQSYARLTLLGPSIEIFKTLWVTGPGAASRATA